MAIDIGTIGSAGCEISLNRILIEQNNERYTNLVMNVHQALLTGLKRLEFLRENKSKGSEFFFKRMALLLYKEEIRLFGERAAHLNLPEVVRTHALCCYKAVYRRSINEGLCK